MLSATKYHQNSSCNINHNSNNPGTREHFAWYWNPNQDEKWNCSRAQNQWRLSYEEFSHQIAHLNYRTRGRKYIPYAPMSLFVNVSCKSVPFNAWRTGSTITLTSEELWVRKEVSIRVCTGTVISFLTIKTEQASFCGLNDHSVSETGSEQATRHCVFSQYFGTTSGSSHSSEKGADSGHGRNSKCG